MSFYPPYQVTHVHLDQSGNQPTLAVPGQGHYLIFWWRTVALGHAVIKPGQLLTEADYSVAMHQAIEPALLHYYAAQPLYANTNWQAWSHMRDPSSLARCLAAVLTPWLLPAAPRQVPISVVICTRQRAADLQHCLESLMRLSCQPQEIIVVDNAPQDSSTERVVAAFPGITYCVEPKPGLSHARNTGVGKVTTTIVAFTDDDVQVHPDWACQVWATFQNPQVFAMTGLVLVSELQTEAQQIFEASWSFNRGYRDVYYDQQYMKQGARPAPPVGDIGAGANSAFRTAAFDEVGLFDLRLGAGASGCSEDSEMWFRILLRGHTIHYNPRAVVYHAHRQELAALKKQLYSYMRGHVAAVLIQQRQWPQAGYWRYVYWHIPRYYARLIKAGLPFFRFRFRTLGVELKGLAAGLTFYYRHRNQPSGWQS